jgi:hypothetical protein
MNKSDLSVKNLRAYVTEKQLFKSLRLWFRLWIWLLLSINLGLSLNLGLRLSDQALSVNSLI